MSIRATTNAVWEWALPGRRGSMVAMLKTASQVGTRALGLIVAMMLAHAAGCIELQEAFRDTDTVGDTPQPNDTDDPSTDGPDDGAPIVELLASNPTPQLNEEVQLLCRVVGGSADGVTFAIQPIQELASLNTTTGTASLIIDLADVGAVLFFACTGTNESGTGPPSNTVVILPVAGAP